MNPKVSVITTLFNYEKYILSCVDSFMAQDFDDSEMIIVDDASTDWSASLVEENFGKEARVNLIKLKNNQGYSHAKNVGVKAAKGEYLVMLDADDMLYPDGITTRYNKITQGFDMVHGPAMDMIGHKARLSKLWKQWMDSKKDASCYRLVHAQGVMVRKDIHSRVGLYDENLRCKSDREMWARVFNHGLKVGWVDTPVSIYRIHPKQMHKSKEKARINDRLQKEVLKIMKRRKTDLSDVEMLDLN